MQWCIAQQKDTFDFNLANTYTNIRIGFNENEWGSRPNDLGGGGGGGSRKNNLPPPPPIFMNSDDVLHNRCHTYNIFSKIEFYDFLMFFLGCFSVF